MNVKNKFQRVDRMFPRVFQLFTHTHKALFFKGGNSSRSIKAIRGRTSTLFSLEFTSFFFFCFLSYI